MNTSEPTRYLSNELMQSNSFLKEVDAGRRKDLGLLSERMNPMIIDYGSQNIIAGYDCVDEPDLIFRPQISKNRDISKSDLPIKAYINTSYDQLDFLKSNFKSPYERNIVLHFSLLQQCNDYIFGQLVKQNKKFRSPLIITEPFANPIHCRTSLLEQIFQCYQIDSVMVGVDALFAYFYQLDCSMTRFQSETALVINIGATTIHIFAMVNGKLDCNSIRRINVGGNNAFELFSRSVLLKNPHLRQKLTYSFLRQIYQKFTSIAIDYKLQLQFFQSRFKEPLNQTIYRNRISQSNAQFPENLTFIPGIEIDLDSVTQIPGQEIKRKQEVRKRMSQKLKDTLNRRKELKKKMHQIELKNYLQLKQRFQAHDKFAHQQVVQMFGEHRPLQKLQKKIKALQLKLGLAEERGEDTKFNLISIPDHELPPEKLKYKKLQIYQKQALEVRKQKQIQKQQQQMRMRQLREINPEVYLHQLKQSYKTLHTRIKDNERIRSELSNRKSKLKQRKMQAIARLAEQDFDPDLEQGEDDWLVYKDLDESEHYSQLEAMEAQLREIDPEWTQAKDHHHLKQTNQLFLLTDLIKCHEIYFEPLLIGVNQLNLVKTITQLLESYPASIADQLRKNILIIGGGSHIPGFSERLIRDLIRQSPTGSSISVSVGRGGCKGAFFGMQYIAKYQRQFLDRFSYKREDYLSNRGNVFVQNPWSNPRPRNL